MQKKKWYETMNGITYDEFMNWLSNQPLEQLNLVSTVVKDMYCSPEISTQNECIVWEDGTIPKTFEEFTLQLSYALDVWAHDTDDSNEGRKYKIVSDILHNYIRGVTE